MAWSAQPCVVCGEEKEPGIRGARYCAACRAAAAATIARIRERRRPTNGRPRAIALVPTVQAPDVVLVPVVRLPWIDEERYRKPNDDTEDAA